MSNNLIITIGRECGSGGRHIGKKLAEELGIKCYDKELIDVAVKKSGLCKEIFETHDEKPTSSFLYSLVMDTYSLGYASSAYMDMPLNHKVFLAQFDTIKQIASEESCVIIGRCADYALADFPNVVTVFITADEDVKINTLMGRHDMTEAQAKSFMAKTDKKRASYYNYYSSKRWGDSKSYDLCINSSKVGLEGAIRIIKAFAEEKQLYLKK
ncbi:MAG: cytidylate kinase-like family protein [Lachnospiraceae bacterium]|nr:cytidylate kinase-like family protein [Lachnospiraceae bacterium]MBQ5599063.1 cytidylate kinase-like family protein [Lachnospiraceae bacterium]MBQ5660527.1 cytidylate kinase-like family protein [Lachnospiraceae bacterium]MBQ5805861.1 cytidylate kinase-like family protein [Lachnospiraceae bacterium]MBQ5869915.1 cytidylate kinase-like family protein [Lachnospiraceae bacterium]